MGSQAEETVCMKVTGKKDFLCSWNQKEAKLSGAKYESDKK